MKVKRLPIDPGTSGWRDILSDDEKYHSLSESIQCDWLIIGAGFAGLAAAKRLKELHKNDAIVVVDACRIGQGPAGRNSGFMIDVPHNLASEDYGGDLEEDRKHMRLNRAGIDYAFTIANEYAMSQEAIIASGKVNAAASHKGVKHNKSFQKYLDLLGEPYTILHRKHMKELTGIDYYIDGLLTPGTAMLQPALFVREFAKGLQRSGVKIYENSPIVKFDDKRNFWVAHTKEHSITAPKIILTVNGHVESFGYFARRLLHVFTYASMTQALTEKDIKKLSGQANWSITPADPLGTTVRRISGHGGDRIIIRNCTTYNPLLEAKKNWLKIASVMHNRAFTSRFPMLKDVSMEYCWGGRLCLSRNNTPVFGEIEKGMYVACCQNGLGTAKGMSSGMLISELASQRQSSLLDDMLSFSKPTLLAPQFLTSIGVKAFIKWAEFKAGKEL